MLLFYLHDLVFHMDLFDKILLKSYKSLPFPFYNQLGSIEGSMALRAWPSNIENRKRDGSRRPKLNYALLGQLEHPPGLLSCTISRSTPITCT